MIEETGVVVSARGDAAEVEVRRGSTCGGCSANGACATSAIARYLGRKQLRLDAINGVGARPGEQVVIGLPEGAMLQLAVVAYLIPLLALIAGAMAGAQLAGLSTLLNAELSSIVGGLAGLAAALAWHRRFSTIASSRDQMRPRILRRESYAGLDRGATLPGASQTAGDP